MTRFLPWIETFFPVLVWRMKERRTSKKLFCSKKAFYPTQSIRCRGRRSLLSQSFNKEFEKPNLHRRLYAVLLFIQSNHQSIQPKQNVTSTVRTRRRTYQPVEKSEVKKMEVGHSQTWFKVVVAVAVVARTVSHRFPYIGYDFGETQILKYLIF